MLRDGTVNGMDSMRKNELTLSPKKLKYLKKNKIDKLLHILTNNHIFFFQDSDFSIFLAAK
ncbi:MAG: hypothetical protein J1E98_14130 [Lachnospiraceae bacterium]|nr:hypothetical protein [Lachnospiraceae bacterium]